MDGYTQYDPTQRYSFSIEDRQINRNVPPCILQLYPQSSILKSDCFCGLSQPYPRYFPKTYFFVSLLSYISKIVSLSTDFVLFYDTLSFDLNKSPYVSLDMDNLARVIFTVLPGFFVLLMYITFTTSFFKGSNKTCLSRCCCVLSPVFMIIGMPVYKITLIFATLYWIWESRKLLAMKSQVNSAYIEKRGERSKAFLFESVLSSWPLLIISLIELQYFMTQCMENNNLNFNSNGIYDFEDYFNTFKNCFGDGVNVNDYSSFTNILLLVKVISGIFSAIGVSGKLKYYSMQGGFREKNVYAFVCFSVCK